MKQCGQISILNVINNRPAISLIKIFQRGLFINMMSRENGGGSVGKNQREKIRAYVYTIDRPKSIFVENVKLRKFIYFPSNAFLKCARKFVSF